MPSGTAPRVPEPPPHRRPAAGTGGGLGKDAAPRRATPTPPHTTVAGAVKGTKPTTRPVTPPPPGATAGEGTGGVRTALGRAGGTGGAATRTDERGMGEGPGRRHRMRAADFFGEDVEVVSHGEDDAVAASHLPAHCGTGTGVNGTTTFGLDWTPPTLPDRGWQAPPVAGIKGPCHMVVPEWVKGLATHPNRAFAAYVTSGLVEGFDTLIDVPEDGTQFNKNSPFLTAEHIEHLDKQWRTEVAAGRYVLVGTDVHPNLRTQSISCVDKRSYDSRRKYRTIINHSRVAGNRASLNCDVQDLELHYITIRDVTAEILRRGPGCRMSCLDMRNAYRQLAKHPRVIHLTGLTWAGETALDTSLEFGGGAAPWIFSTVAQALCYICQQDLDAALGAGAVTVYGYLDDINLVALDEHTAGRAYDIVLATWARLGVDYSEEKCLRAKSVAVWLGLQLDTINATVDLPEDKKKSYLESVRRVINGTSSRGSQLEALAGRLGFSHNVHADIRCFVSETHRLAHSGTRPEHQRRHTARITMDMRVWELFLVAAPAANMESTKDLRQTPGQRWHREPGETTGVYWLCGDASGGKEDGESHGGGFYGGDDKGANFHSFRAWTTADRADLSTTNNHDYNDHGHDNHDHDNRCQSKKTNSVYLETVVMAEAVTTWLHTTTHANCTLEYWTDSTGVQWNWRKGRSSNGITNECLRRITLPLLARGVTLVVRWAPREDLTQAWADTLSHCTAPQALFATWPASRRFLTPVSPRALTAASLKEYSGMLLRRWQTAA